MIGRGLIVTADDFGAAEEVNDAVEMAHRQGVLTAASLMVGAPATDDAVSRAKATPTLRVGLHLVLVEGRPVLSPETIPALVDADGHFNSDMTRAGITMFFRPDGRRQLEAEIAAQFEAFARTGLRLDHVNAHKHFHLHPTIASTILKVGKQYGMRAARFPIEPASVLACVEPGGAYRREPIIDLWAGLARSRFRRAGILVPDQVFGLRWSGAMTTARLRGLLDHLPSGLTEIYLHPATQGGFEGAAMGYRYSEELAALVDPEVVASASRSNLTRGGFDDLNPGGGS